METLPRIALALVIGTVGGAVFYLLNLPLPWMCMLTGARVGEVRQAKFADFNLEHLVWTVSIARSLQLPISFQRLCRDAGSFDEIGQA